MRAGVQVGVHQAPLLPARDPGSGGASDGSHELFTVGYRSVSGVENGHACGAHLPERCQALPTVREGVAFVSRGNDDDARRGSSGVSHEALENLAIQPAATGRHQGAVGRPDGRGRRQGGLRVGRPGTACRQHGKGRQSSQVPKRSRVAHVRSLAGSRDSHPGRDPSRRATR